MKRLLSILLLFCAASVFGAVTIKQANVESSGWILNVTVGSEGLGGDFNFGFGTNNSGPGNIVLTLTSTGYDTTGATTTRTRTLSAGKQLRFPYGTAGQSSVNYISDVTASGSDVIIRVSLSDYVFSTDTGITMTVAANWYSNNVPATNAMVVVNNSTTLHSMAKVGGNWTWPNWDRITGNTFKLRCKAYHRSAMNGSPVACVMFRAVDQHTHTNLVTVPVPTIDWVMGDAAPVQEFIGTMDASGLTALDIITCDFIAYPWIGDSGAVLDTSDGVNTEFQPYYHTQHLLNDKNGNFSTAIALVNQTTGVLAAIVHTNGTIPTLAYASINQAAAAIARTNNSKFGHNDSAGGIIYIQSTNSFSGTSDSAPTTRGSTYLLITNYPGDSTAALVNGTGPGNVNSLTKCGGLIIQDNPNDAFVFSGVSNIWFDACTFNVTNSSQDYIDGVGQHFVTRCIINQFDQGFQQQGSQNTIFGLVRGCRQVDKLGVAAAPNVHPYNVIGNLRTSTNVGFQFSTAQTMTFSPQWLIIADNRLYNYFVNGTIHSFYGGSLTCSNGFVLANNVFESILTNDAAIILNFVHADSASGNMTNFIDLDNTMVGARCNEEYNDTGSAAVWSVLGVKKNNLYSHRAQKSDTFGTQNGARVGNWSIEWGVGCSGNCILDTANISSSGSFQQEFPGLNCFVPALTPNTSPPQCATTAYGYPQFLLDGTSPNTALGTVNGLGNGNYRVQPSSPLFTAQTSLLLPNDIAGKARSSLDPPGAFAFYPPTILVKGATTYLQKGATTVLQP